MNELQINSSFSALPSIPFNVVPTSGFGIKEDKLIESSPGVNLGQALTRFRLSHGPEKCSFRRCYWAKEKNGNVQIFYILNFDPFKIQPVGITSEDLGEIKIAIGNHANGAFLTSIKWELYADKEGEDLLDIGRFDQWDLLSGISREEIALLEEKDIRPNGNWDFDRLLMDKKCPVCSQDIGVNYVAYNIDSAVCDKCGNRPFLSPHIENLLDSIQSDCHPNSMGLISCRQIDHMISWIASVEGNADEVDNIDRSNKARIRHIMNNSLIGMAVNEETSQYAQRVIDENSTLPFPAFQS